jgi:hypothetical protein
MIGYAGNLGKDLMDAPPEVRRAIIIGSSGQRRHGMDATTLAVAKYFRALRNDAVSDDLGVEGESEESDTPKWLLPAGLAAGAGMLVLFVVMRRKKKKTSK